MCYNIHYESMRKMQSEKARDGVLSSKQSEGVQAMQEQTYRQDQPTISRRVERKGATALLARPGVPMSKVSIPESRHPIPITRPHQWKRRTRQKCAASPVPMDKKRGLSRWVPSPLFQLQPRKVQQWKMSSPNAIVPQVAEMIFRAIPLPPCIT